MWKILAGYLTSTYNICINVIRENCEISKKYLDGSSGTFSAVVGRGRYLFGLILRRLSAVDTALLQSKIFCLNLNALQWNGFLIKLEN